MEYSKLKLCHYCNYTCHLSRKRFSSRAATWDKLILLRNLQKCDFALWLDADIVVVRPFLIPIQYNTLFSQDYYGINAGAFLLRLNNANRIMLDTVIKKYEEYKHRSSQEQLAIKAFYRQNSHNVSVAENFVTYFPGFFVPKKMKHNKQLRIFPPLRHAAGCPKTSLPCMKWLFQPDHDWKKSCDSLEQSKLYVRRAISSDFRNKP